MQHIAVPGDKRPRRRPALRRRNQPVTLLAGNGIATPKHSAQDGMGDDKAWSDDVRLALPKLSAGASRSPLPWGRNAYR